MPVYQSAGIIITIFMNIVGLVKAIRERQSSFDRAIKCLSARLDTLCEYGVMPQGSIFVLNEREELAYLSRLIYARNILEGDWRWHAYRFARAVSLSSLVPLLILLICGYGSSHGKRMPFASVSDPFYAAATARGFTFVYPLIFGNFILLFLCARIVRWKWANSRYFAFGLVSPHSPIPVRVINSIVTDSNPFHILRCAQAEAAKHTKRLSADRAWAVSADGDFARWVEIDYAYHVRQLQVRYRELSRWTRVTNFFAVAPATPVRYIRHPHRLRDNLRDLFTARVSSTEDPWLTIGKLPRGGHGAIAGDPQIMTRRPSG